jgi:hypothetical protein
MPPPCGAGACWYWPAKLYSPIPGASEMRHPTGATHARAERAADLLEHFRRLALGMQCLAAASGKIPRPPQRLDLPGLVFLGDCREAHDVPIFLGQHVADEIVPRVKPEGRLSCSRCMITTIFPFRLSFSRL